MKPALSVVMPVYNAQEYLSEAVDSILGQTFRDFEFIIVDDGSRDESAALLKSYKDPRIRLFHQANQGQMSALRRGIAVAKAECIARMDADDVSMPERFAEQMSYLKDNPDVALLGTAYVAVDENGKTLAVVEVPLRHIDIHRALFAGSSPFGHGTVIFKKSAYLEAGGYRDDFGPAADYDLWIRMGLRYPTANLPGRYYRYRMNSSGISHTQFSRVVECGRELQEKLWNSEPFPILTPSQTRSGLRFYSDRGQAERFIADQWRALQLLKRHHLWTKLAPSLMSYTALGAEGARYAIVRKYRGYVEARMN